MTTQRPSAAGTATRRASAADTGGDAYARAGVDTGAADRAIGALVAVLRTIDTGRATRSVPLPGHYAAVLEVAPNLGIAVGTDGVGSKLIVAELTGRYDTVGIDCIAMNVNDVICVGAEPIAVLDYLAVERTDPGVFQAIARGLKAGAEQAGVEIPGGEVAVLPELIRGHPSPGGFDLTAACVGTVALDRIVTGAGCAPGDALVGLPSSGLHSNGFTLARRVLEPLGLGERPPALGGASVADVLLEPTAIYVRAVLDLLRSGLPVHGLAHITGGGLANLLRLSGDVGFTIEEPLPEPPVFGLVREHGAVPEAEMWGVFNMGCGFVVVVPEAAAGEAVALLAAHHPGAARIGSVTGDAGRVAVPPLGIAL
jgi:phosphoribosylformylglycinamidine cyclo-ligase